MGVYTRPPFVIGLIKALDQATVRERARLGHALRSRLRTTAGNARKDLGCTLPQLKVHLETQFLPGMTWENYGQGRDKWCIDHIMPLAAVDSANKRQLLKVLHYSNLRPLWFLDNCAKGAKVTGKPSFKAQLPAEPESRRFPKPLHVIMYEGTRRVEPPDPYNDTLKSALVSAIEAQ